VKPTRDTAQKRLVEGVVSEHDGTNKKESREMLGITDELR